MPSIEFVAIGDTTNHVDALREACTPVVKLSHSWTTNGVPYFSIHTRLGWTIAAVDESGLVCRCVDSMRLDTDSENDCLAALLILIKSLDNGVNHASA